MNIGRYFTPDTMKKFKQSLIRMVNSFTPIPPKNAVKIKFHKIVDKATQKFVENKLIVLLKIKKGSADCLFTNEEGRGYYRLDGQTRKYSPEEYQEELISRATKHGSNEEQKTLDNIEVAYKTSKKESVADIRSSTNDQEMPIIAAVDPRSYQQNISHQAWQHYYSDSTSGPYTFLGQDLNVPTPGMEYQYRNHYSGGPYFQQCNNMTASQNYPAFVYNTDRVFSPRNYNG